MSEPTKDDGEETVILARLSDPVEAGALRELLEAEGIAVSTPGLAHRSMLGMAGGYVEIVVRVPAKDRDKAQELFDGLRTASPPSDEPTRPEDRSRTDRLKRIAVFAACVLTFGAGHFYARRTRGGAILLVLEIVCIALATQAPLFAYAIPGIALADALGACLLIGGDQRGTPFRFAAIAGPALAALAIGLVPAMLGIAPRTLAGSDAVRACERAAACESPEPAETCIDRAAMRTFVGTGSRAGDHACADCLEQHSCAEAASECVCEGRVDLAPPPDDVIHGPAGTRPDDMQHVIPDLFRRPGDADDAPPPLDDAQLDQLLRSLEERRTEP